MRLRLPGGHLSTIATAALFAGVACAIVLPGTTAAAKSDYDSPYGYERTWNAALRLVRVDLGLKVLEKDERSGYLLFEYRSPESGTKATSASFEIVHGAKDSSAVKVVVQIPQMPTFHERAMLDGLSHKMHDEYGDPPSAHRDPPPPAEEPDAGADSGDDDYAN
jgi:hypothetical protein